jgi:hypothetical protein
LPNNYNETWVDFNVQQDPHDKPIYKPGSAIRFHCKEGYFVYSNLSLITVCQPDGQWSPVADCEPHPCWHKLPKRPLNGVREIGLVLNSLTGSTKGSHANFSCNPMFELVGRERIHCVDGFWENHVPECQPIKNICRVKPTPLVNFTMLKSLVRVEFKVELDYSVSQLHTAFTLATYVCAANTNFKDMTNVTKKVFNDVSFLCKNVTCIGTDKWDNVPTCV